jgi:class 3 adenylate cyclase
VRWPNAYVELPVERRIEFRIGINLRDLINDDTDIFGDGVNVAARPEGLAEPGGICVSARAQEDAAGRLDLAWTAFCSLCIDGTVDARPSSTTMGRRI